MILPPLLFYVLMLLGKHALLPSKQSGGHPSVNSLEGIPVSSMSWDLLLYPVHKITMSKPCLFYFASFGAKLGASARQVLRIRKYFKDGKDAATIKAQREVKILGGLQHCVAIREGGGGRHCYLFFLSVYGFHGIKIKILILGGSLVSICLYETSADICLHTSMCLLTFFSQLSCALLRC